MKKLFQGAVCAAIACSMAFGLAACGNPDDGGGNGNVTYKNPEEFPLTLGIGAVDRVFNPFFYTSANDGTVIAETQISMLSATADGQPYCGEDWPTVAKAYSQTMYDSNGNPTEDATLAAAEKGGSTKYEFVIKNGIKFSNGENLTVKDVLFNLYVYLDPAYTGSSTIYSTDIKGLAAYRTQNPDATSDSDGDTSYVANAQLRLNNIVTFYTVNNSGIAFDSVKKDVERASVLFKEELERDWTNATSWETTYKETHSFTAQWQAFLFQEGIIQEQTKKNPNGTVTRLKDKDGRFLTTLDPIEGNVGQEQATQIIALFEGKTEEQCKEIALDYVYSAYFSDNLETSSEIAEVLMYWATGGTLLQEFIGEERTKYFNQQTQGGLRVKQIDGITTYKTKAGDKVGDFVCDEAYDVLSIEINGVDPKAIWNFGFTVTPLSYYSGTYEGVNYVERALNTDPMNKNVDNRFGVKFGDTTFFRDVINGDDNRVPVGAGAYKAVGASADQFFKDNYISYVRNDYFETVGEELSNAKIKNMRYRVVSEERVLDQLQTGGIVYGAPSASRANVSRLAEADFKHVQSNTYAAGGYGYVGINPKYIPNEYIRRAIFKAMDTTQTIASYYGSDLAELIYRPVSKTSWAYNEDEWTSMPESVRYNANTVDAEIKALLAQAGYADTDGDGIASGEDGNLKFTFTIAGETTQHPAYAMFNKAKQILERNGFSISVTTDPTALSKLQTGDLAVWAAAWSSGIDPDPYQVYHMDSKATSVNNWNYFEILNNSNDPKWSFEYEQIVAISQSIDKGRQTLSQEARAIEYETTYSLIMDLAVELPTYQRKEMYAYDKTILDGSTLYVGEVDGVIVPNDKLGPLSRIWEVNYYVKNA